MYARLVKFCAPLAVCLVAVALGGCAAALGWMASQNQASSGHEKLSHGDFVGALEDYAAAAMGEGGKGAV